MKLALILLTTSVARFGACARSAVSTPKMVIKPAT
jgi:hypothetical protein